MSLQLWEDGWAERVPKKMLAAVLLSGCGSVISSRRQFVSVWQNLPMHVVGYSGIMALFATVQETMRGVRARHDVWNSLVAGTLAGGLAAGYYQGPQYRVLGALVWGPLCSMLHVLNDATQPKHLLEDLLVSEGLLSPLVTEQREHVKAAAAFDAAQHGQATQGHSSIQLSMQQEADAIRKREMQALMQHNQRAWQEADTQPQQATSGGPAHLESRQQRQGSSGAQAPVDTSDHVPSTPKRRGWWGWLTGQRKQGAEARLEGHQERLGQDTAHVQHAGHEREQGDGRDVQDDEDEAEDYARWLSEQQFSAEGLVMPPSSPGGNVS